MAYKGSERPLHFQMFNICFMLAVHIEHINAAPLQSVPQKPWLEDINTAPPIFITGVPTGIPINTHKTFLTTKFSYLRDSSSATVFGDLSNSGQAEFEQEPHSAVQVEETSMTRNGASMSKFVPVPVTHSPFQSSDRKNTNTEIQHVVLANDPQTRRAVRTSKHSQIYGEVNQQGLDFTEDRIGSTLQSLKSFSSMHDNSKEANARVSQGEHATYDQSNVNTMLPPLSASKDVVAKLEDNLARLAMRASSNLTHERGASLETNHAHHYSARQVTVDRTNESNDRKGEEPHLLTKAGPSISDNVINAFSKTSASFQGSSDDQLGTRQNARLITNNISPEKAANVQHYADGFSGMNNIGHYVHDQDSSSLDQNGLKEKTATERAQVRHNFATTSNPTGENPWSFESKGQRIDDNRLTSKIHGFYADNPVPFESPRILKNLGQLQRNHHHDLQDATKAVFRRMVQMLFRLPENLWEKPLLPKPEFPMTRTKQHGSQPPETQHDVFQVMRRGNNESSGRFLLSVDEDFSSSFKDFRDAPHKTTETNVNQDLFLTKSDLKMLLDLMEPLLFQRQFLSDQSETDSLSSDDLATRFSPLNERQKSKRTFNSAFSSFPTKPNRHPVDSGISTSKRRGFRACNSKRLNFKTLLEFFLTGKMCGSNVVRMRFGIGRR